MGLFVAAAGEVAWSFDEISLGLLCSEVPLVL